VETPNGFANIGSINGACKDQLQLEQAGTTIKPTILNVKQKKRSRNRKCT